MSKEKVIRKISLSSLGLKGLVIEGTQEIIKDNKVYPNNTFKDGLKNPIHLDLENHIQELRYHVLDVCGLITESTNKNDRMALMSNTDIVSFEFGFGEEQFFKIKATNRVFDDKFQTITTPKVESTDNYEFFDTVMNIIKSILEEVDQYTKGLKKISDEELVINYIRRGKGGGITMDELNEMTTEEKMEYCTTFIEKQGGFVLINDDVEVEEVEEEPEVKEQLTFEEISEVKPLKEKVALPR